LKVAKAKEKLWLIQHRIVNCLWYIETERPIMIILASSGSVKGDLK